VIVLFDVERQESHQVRAIRMVRIHCERLLAAALRLERAAGLHVGLARFIKRGCGLRDASVSRIAGFSGS
jgi:hypothetical protein